MHCKTLTILSVLVAFNVHAQSQQVADVFQPIVSTCWDGDRIAPAHCGSTGDCGGCSTCEPRCPEFELSGGYLYMTREHNRNSQLVTATNTGDTLLGMSDLEGTFESGFEIRGRLSRFEFRYLEISSEDSFRIPASGVSQIRFLSDDYFSTMDLDYDTDLQSAEFNLLFSDPCEAVRLSGGFRYLQLDEDLDARFPGFTGAIFTQTRNELYGLQLGVDADLWTSRDRCFSLICTSKAGVYYSGTDLDIFPNAAGAVTLGSTSDSSERGAFVGELGLLMRVQATRCLSFDAGYNLLYITGVALVGDQPQSGNLQPLLPATSSIENGDVLYHGLMTRATLSF